MTANLATGSVVGTLVAGIAFWITGRHHASVDVSPTAL
jgi:hypothetical protein